MKRNWSNAFNTDSMLVRDEVLLSATVPRSDAGGTASEASSSTVRENGHSGHVGLDVGVGSGGEAIDDLDEVLVSPGQLRWKALRRTVLQSMSPPVLSVILGLGCGTASTVKGLLWPPEEALLGSVVKGMVRLAGAALPISMLLLGVSISKGPDWKAVDMRTNICVCAAKMGMLPIVAVGALSALAHTVGPRWRFFDTSEEWHVPIVLTALCVSAMPTGNTMLMLVELGGGDRASLSTLIFFQYLVSPLVLTVSLALFVVSVTSGVL